MKIVLVEHHRYAATLRVGSHHVARELLERGHELVWVSHPRSWPHGLRERRPPRLVQHEDGVVEVIPRVRLPYIDLPLLGSRFWGERWLDDLALAPLEAELGDASADGNDCDLLWISDFTMLSMLDHLMARKVVLRFFDHLDEFRWMPRSIYALARRYQARVDLAIGSSRELVARLADEGIDSLYVPNGAHVRPGARKLVETTPRGNRLVYVGAIESWFDHEAVELWAAGLPEYRFEIAGPVGIDVRSSLPNLEYLGPVSYECLPRLLASARFGLIPFKINALTRGIHPLKLYDYLMYGCPVLSAALPEVKADDRGIFVYRDAEEGLELLRSNLDRCLDHRSLHELAVSSSWGSRLRSVFGHLGLPWSPGPEC